MSKQLFKKQKGQIALIAILIISAAILIVSLAMTSLGINETIMGYDEQQSEQAFQIADSCPNEALLRLHRVYNGDEDSYTGETIDFGSNSCIIVVTEDGDDRIVDITSTVNSKIHRKIRMNIQIAPTFILDTWQEIQ